MRNKIKALAKKRSTWIALSVVLAVGGVIIPPEHLEVVFNAASLVIDIF